MALNLNISGGNSRRSSSMVSSELVVKNVVPCFRPRVLSRDNRGPFRRSIKPSVIKHILMLLTIIQATFLVLSPSLVHAAPKAAATSKQKPQLPPLTSKSDHEVRSSGSAGKEEWHYDEQQRWSEKFPQCVKNGPRQSPIDIITPEVIYNPHLSINLIDYDQELEFQIKNTHHSVSLTPVPAVPGILPVVKLGWLDEDNEFELKDIHFHWGDHNKKGSEHLINGERSEAEMHMVHYRKGVNKDQIGSIPNSLLVIGVFIKSEPGDNNKFNDVVSGTQKVNGTDNAYTIENNDIINLLPDDIQSFYTYNGSLTTPPCYEIVTWIVMKDPVYMGRQQLSELADLYADEEGRVFRIAPNYREPQGLSGRRVYSSFPIVDDGNNYPGGADMDPNAIDGPNSMPGGDDAKPSHGGKGDAGDSEIDDPNSIDNSLEEYMSRMDDEMKKSINDISNMLHERRSNNNNLLNQIGRHATRFGYSRRRMMPRRYGSGAAIRRMSRRQ